MTENEISYEIRGAIFSVYNELGPGLLERVYQAALTYELKKRGLKVKVEVPVNVLYDCVKLDVNFRLDLVVENKIIVELKSVEELKKVHFKQLITYLKINNLKLGLLVNFNTNDITKSIKRIANNL